MHAAEVCKELKRLNPSVTFVGWGGSAMKAAGVDIRRDIGTLAIMGFWEVIKKIFFVKKLFTECKQMIVGENPDLILFIDYSGFNLRLAKWSAAQGYTNHYFIPPKTWAWNQSRTKKLRKFFSKVYSILPFEKPFFESFDVNVEYVGNPSKEAVDKLKLTKNEPTSERRTVALIPGSRASEVKLCLPYMCSLKRTHPEFDYEISGVDSVDRDLYNIAAQYQIPVRFNSFYDVLNRSDFAVVTSGTATLETALLNVPQVVVFKTSWLTYQIARFFIKVKYISLVNLIADDLVVEELIQHNFSTSKLAEALNLLRENEVQIKEKYKLIRDRLGEKRPAIEVAKQINTALTILK